MKKALYQTLLDLLAAGAFVALLVGGWFLVSEVAIAGGVHSFILQNLPAQVADYGC